MDILLTIQYYLVLVYNSTFVGFIRFLLIIYIVVLLIDVVLLLILRGVRGNIIQGFYGADVPSSHKGMIARRWKKIEAQLRSGNEAQYKLAIIDADAIADEVLQLANLAGENMMERLEASTPYQVEHKDRLLWAHSTRNSIIRDDAFVVDSDLAEKTIEVYREFLKSWETL